MRRLLNSCVSMVCRLEFDYRGMGESLPPQFANSLRGFDADINDWAELDYNSAPAHRKGLACGCSFAGDRPFTRWSARWFASDNHLIDGLVTIGSGTSYWRHNAPPTKRMVWLLWYFSTVVHTSICGYFPGRNCVSWQLTQGRDRTMDALVQDPRYFVDGMVRV